MDRAGADFENEDALIDALSRGDDSAFTWLLDQYDGWLRRAALTYVPSRAVADEVAQDTWLAVIRGLATFERRSSLKTWIYAIMMNIARKHGQNEHRSIPFTDAASAAGEPAIESERFRPFDDAQWPGHWWSFPPAWEHQPEERLLSAEMLAFVADTIAALPHTQRQVITLRDVEGWSASEVCNALTISETNQRMLLHRARMKVRAACEHRLGTDEP